ncbi:YwbE family protein [Desulfosporosinus sp. Sb-LF]|uniref:YwbE family protein n=1 Tax=Desulfosporosinus sp. Sb-LF TaxID=2560027 RepID=UPI00107F8870|nr:YwbE family protein [Desulfosporosinus sp. Sb-LF]TGE32055.1 YwbE family protein [Desulfosporosinus sp. Sb-LF]
MKGQSRKDIYAGITVDIVLKADQRTGKLTRGVVKDILTNSQNHSRGIKVRLVDGQVGRVQEIIN